MSAQGDPAVVPWRWRSRLPRVDWGVVFWMLAIKTVVLGFAAISVRTLFGDDFTLREMWNRWDAAHYLSLAQSGYTATGEERFSLVLFPLYPWLVRALAAFFSWNFFASALVISGLASIAAGLLLQRLTRLDASPVTARYAIWFLFIFPTSYFLHIGYAESLFLALVLGSVLAARTDRWPLAGVLGACASFTRVNGLILLPTLAVEAWQQYRANRHFDWRWLWIIGVGCGFAAYLSLNYYVAGDFFAFSQLQQEHWFKKLTPPWVGIHAVWLRIPGTNITEGLHEFCFILLGFVCTIWCSLRLRPSYAVWMTCNWLFITSISFLISVPRYTLTFFPIFILFAQVATRRPLLGALLSLWSVAFLVLFATKFAHGTWAF
ncbi:MAG: hypothetical protein ABR589_01795 [Chthoniobacterales bacterium]